MRRRMWRWTSPVIVALAASVSGAQEGNPFTAAAQELLAQRSARGDLTTHSPAREVLERIYGTHDPLALWSTLDGKPTNQAHAAIGVLASSDARGLPPADYDVTGLRALAPRASDPRDKVARFDVALTHAIASLLADLHAGRVDPRTFGIVLPDVADTLDLAALVADVARATDVPAAIARVEPPYAGYAALVRALARYRVLAADTTLRPPRTTPHSIRPGDQYADIPALKRLLRALGDLDSATSAIDSSPNATSPGASYDGALVDAIGRFQRRHGLDPDGTIGAATMAQLRIPLRRRVRQIEVTLERWRWLPRRPPDQYVVVNIPGFRLYAFENDSVAARPALVMNVIVGQARGRHDTPMLTATMREVVVRPYWDVPQRIARAELIPQFRRRPASFWKEGFEIVRRGTGDVDAVTYPPTAQNFARVVAGELRLRQQPGAANALGLIKFVFPNRYSVYLHGTPAQALFTRSRRDFSHGCIRIEEPTDLAEWVLRDQSPWDRATIEARMQGARTVHVPLARPVAVYVVYATAAADEAGIVSFWPDLYGHDATLEQALGVRQ